MATLYPNGARHYYHQDRQGSVYALTGDDGQPHLLVSYTAYGEPSLYDGSGRSLGTTGARAMFGYHGLPHDFALGLVDLRARAYLPTLGRFLSPDPIKLAGGANLFAFVDSGPLTWRDPLGLAREDGGGDGPRRSLPGRLLGLGRSAVGAALDYAHGRVEGAIETAEDLGDLAWSAAKCTAKGAFCYIERIERAVDTGRSLYAAAPHVARAVADDPWAVTVQVVKHAACRGDGCSLRDLARNEVKIVVAAASGRGPALAAAAVDDAVRLAARAGAVLRRLARSGDDVAASAGAAARSAASGLDDLAKFRGELGLAQGEGTLARLDVGGHSFYGINAHGQPVSLRVNAITRTHAEADAFQQAANAGLIGGRGTLYVDRALCLACGQNGGVRAMMRQLGLVELEVITPQGTQVIRP